MLFLFLSTGFVLSVQGQDDKSKRPSPPASVAVTTTAGVTITINYSRPSLKGRQLGSVDFVPLGQVWRTGANEATTVEISRDATIEGKALPAGKYSLFTIPGESESTIIFNKQWEQWGAFKYNEADDALRVTVPTQQNGASIEQFTITAGKEGKVSLTWGNWLLAFTVK